MTTANALVAAPVDTSTPFQGAFLLEDGEALVAAIRSGDWVAGGLAAFSAVADTVAAVMDPLGSLIAAGLGWVMEHLEPLKGWLDDLTGDAAEVAAFAQTWANISGQLSASGDELARILHDLGDADGEAVQAYLRFQADTAEHLRAAGTWADAMSFGLQTASALVQIVHDLTRDAIAQVVGSVISYAATLVISLGTATPYVIAQASSRVASLATRVSSTVTKLLKSSDELMRLVDQLSTLFRKLESVTERALTGGRRGPDAPGHVMPSRPTGAPPTEDTWMLGSGPEHRVPRAEYDQTFSSSVHNADADSVMLGKYDGGGDSSYITRAGDDHTYFDLGSDWDDIKARQGLSAQEMFDVYNTRFLDEAIAQRKAIDFSHDPRGDRGFLGQELQYLLDHGYRFYPDTMSARPRS